MREEADPVRIIVLWMATGRAVLDRIAGTYLQFTDVCGWTPDQWQERTVAVLISALVAP